MSQNKTGRNMGLRLDAQTDQRLSKLEEETGLEGVTVARQAMVAVLDFYEENGFVIFPMKLVPRHAPPKGDLVHRLNEEGALSSPVLDGPTTPYKVKVTPATAGLIQRGREASRAAKKLSKRGRSGA